MTRAQLAMRGLTRDVNGQLRTLDGQFATSSRGMGQNLAYQIGSGARSAVAALAKVAPAVAGIGVGLPAVAAVTTGLMGLAAGAVAAGLAVKAFSLAVQPQMTAITDVATLAEEAEKAAADGAKDAAEKQKAYTDALADLPPATRGAAKAFIGLKKDYKDWSDGLSSTTMPLLTKGIEILRGLLPTLTPFVKAAAEAIGGFLDEVAVGVKSAGFKQWAADMAAAAGPALTNFLAVIKNLAIGFGGMLQAFLPVSDGMTGGLVKMSEAFANWGSSLKGSEGFAQFMELARQGGQTLGQLALAVGNLLVALGPLIGITTQIALALARLINALPPGVLSVLATTITTVVIAMKAWAIGARVVAVANRLMASSTYVAIAGWARMMATGIAAYARIAAAALVSAARTAAAWAGAALRSMATFAAQIIRTAAVAAAQFLMMAARAIAWAAVMAAQWLIAMGPIGWVIAAVVALVALVIANWDKVKAWTLAAWNAVVSAVTAAVNWILAGVAWLGSIPGKISEWFGQAKTWAIVKMAEMVIWLQGLPGRILGAISGLLGRLKDWAARSFYAFHQMARDKITSMIAWVRGLPGRIVSAIGSLKNLLMDKGADLIRGLFNGVQRMGGWLKDKLIGFAKSMIPGPIAKALGIASPSRLMADKIGHWIPAGIAQGVEANTGVLDRTMAGLVNTPSPSAAMAASMGGAPAVAGGRSSSLPTVTHRLDLAGPLGDVIVSGLRDKIKINGGNVQLYLGRG
ncbi:hypothetical protein [Streptomyces sp. BH105]|uniref:hypothetical protein n=1 Tax=Streptomyces sp. BH105 TaxID=3410408 RepID=UPI003CF6780B